MNCVRKCCPSSANCSQATARGERPDDLDFYECRFNAAFGALRIDVVRRELKRLKQTAEPPGPSEEREPDAHEKDAPARLFEAVRTREAINALPPDERKAVVLCHVYGLKGGIGGSG